MAFSDFFARFSAWLQADVSAPHAGEPPLGSTVAVGDQVWHRRTHRFWRNCELGTPQNPVDKTWAELKQMGSIEVIHSAARH